LAQTSSFKARRASLLKREEEKLDKAVSEHTLEDKVKRLEREKDLLEKQHNNLKKEK
jgi:hypothetical protein